MLDAPRADPARYVVVSRTEGYVNTPEVSNMNVAAVRPVAEPVTGCATGAEGCPLNRRLQSNEEIL